MCGRRRSKSRLTLIDFKRCALLQELTKAWEDGTIMYFYQIISARGQAPTNHARYFQPRTSPSDPPTYLVDEWKLGYEPYLIFRKDGPPWCDERFIGFGHNKEACAGEMLLSGMRFHVLKEHFITHRKHVKDGAENKNNEASRPRNASRMKRGRTLMMTARPHRQLQRNNRMWDNWEKDQCMRCVLPSDSPHRGSRVLTRSEPLDTSTCSPCGGHCTLLKSR